MKPLQLSFSGLNSYISKADIDFTLFLKNKIFGVFGKTGAGKSTIIDAITYALFGRIDRVGNEIKTSINPKTKRLFVSFTFQTGKNIYKITRTKTERKTEATLYQIKDNKETPVAERDREVNEMISKLIGGFDYNEFTKVIALPQNKFSEFLMAKPSERATLLEKIFGLERYGDRLWSRLTEKEKINSLELNSIENNLEQLSHVGEEQLRERQSRLKEIEKKRDAEIEGLKKKEERLSELRELDKLQKGRQAVEEQIENLKAKGPEIENLRERLKNAENAAPYRRDIENMDYWQKEIKRASNIIEDSVREIEELQGSLNKLKEEERLFQEEKSSRERDIAVKLRSVEEAVKLSDKIKEIDRERLIKEKNLSEVKRKLDEKTLEIKNLTGEREQLEKKRSKLKSMIEEIALSDEEARLLDEISDTEKHIGTINEIENYLSKEQENLKVFSSSIEEEKIKIIKLWEDTLSDSPLRVPEKADEELGIIKKNVQTKIESITSQIHELKLAYSAFYLARELKEGMPCPVCGSKIHPSPAVKSRTDEIPILEKRLNEEKKTLEQIEKLEDELKKSLKTLSDYIISMKKSEKNVSDLIRRGKIIKEEILKKTGLSVEECERKKKYFDDRLRKLAKLTGEIEKIQRGLDGIDLSIKSMEDEITRIKVDSSRLEEEVKQIKRLILEHTSQIKNLIGDESPEKLRSSLLKEERVLKEKSESYKKSILEKENEIKILSEKINSEKGKKEELEKNLIDTKQRIDRELIILGISEEEFRSYITDDESMKRMRREIESYEKSLKELEGRLKEIEEQMKKLKIKSVDEKTLKDAEIEVSEAKKAIDNFNKEIGGLNQEIKNIMENLDRRKEMLKRKEEKEKEQRAIKDLLEILRGKEFVHFIVRELGKNIVKLASDSFYYLTNERMSLRLADDKFNFYINDHLTGIERPVDTLSGGEIFLASFSLALALSRHIQTMKARSIHFFFIDEGFGSLDDETLTSVAGVMDKLRNEDVLVGFISHRKELKELVSTQIIVSKSPIEGSKIKLVL